MSRLFVALDPPLQIKQQLLAIHRSLSGARWQTVEQLHITVNFIGEVDNSLVPEIIRALAIIQAKPIELHVQGVDYFGSKREPRMLYAKVSANPELTRLKKLINHQLGELNIVTEKKKFKPHVTLARLHQAKYESVAPIIQQQGLFKTNSFVLNEFHLFSSKLQPKGAQYIIEQSYALKSSGEVQGSEKGMSEIIWTE